MRSVATEDTEGAWAATEVTEGTEGGWAATEVTEGTEGGWAATEDTEAATEGGWAATEVTEGTEGGWAATEDTEAATEGGWAATEDTEAATEDTEHTENAASKATIRSVFRTVLRNRMTGFMVLYFLSKKAALSEGLTFTFSMVHSSTGLPSTDCVSRCGSITPSTFL